MEIWSAYISVSDSTYEGRGAVGLGFRLSEPTRGEGGGTVARWGSGGAGGGEDGRMRAMNEWLASGAGKRAPFVCTHLAFFGSGVNYILVGRE